MNALQRRQQIGRIHAAKTTLGLGDDEYRSLLEALTGFRSCSDMTDRLINHVLDWLNWMAGRRARQPISFDRLGRDPHANLVSVCYAVAKIVPPGYEVSPIRSMVWQERTCGKSAAFFEDLSSGELWRLIEGLKAIFARAGTRHQETTLDQKPLSPDARRPDFFQPGGFSNNAGIGGKNTVDVRIYLAGFSFQRRCESDSRDIRTTPSECSNFFFETDALKTSYDGHVIFIESLMHTDGPDFDDPRIVMIVIRYDAGLGAAQRYRGTTLRIECNGEQRRADALAAAEQHIHFARRRIGRE